MDTKFAGLCLLTALAFLAALLPACVNREFPITQDYTVTENKTEYVTESYTENGTYSKVASGEFELPSFTNWASVDITFNNVGNVYYYGYDVPDVDLYDNISVRIEIWNQPQYEQEFIKVFDMSKVGHLTYPEPRVEGEETKAEDTAGYVIIGAASMRWLQASNAALSHARFLGARTNQWSNQDNPQTMEFEAGRASKIAIIISGPSNKWNTFPRLFIRWTASSPVYGPITRERTIEKQVPQQVTRQRTYYQIRSVPIWEILLPAR